MSSTLLGWSLRAFGVLTVILPIFCSTNAQAEEPIAKLHLKLSHILSSNAVPTIATASVKFVAEHHDVSLSELFKQRRPCGATNSQSINGLLYMEHVIHHVICQRLGVREGFGLTEQAQAALELAESQRFPSLGLTAGFDKERGAGKVNNTVALRMDWLLFDFGSTSASIEQSRKALAAVLDDQQAEVLLAVADAAQLFATAKTAHGRFETTEKNLNTAQNSLRMIEAKSTAGASSLAEKAQAQTALAQAQLEHVRAQSQWLSSSGALAIAMGLSANQKIEFDNSEMLDDAFFESAIDIPALIVEAKSRHPRIAAARARLAEADARNHAAQAERWGNVSLSAVAGRIRTSGYTEFRDTGSASVLWTLPLFDGGAISARQRNVLGQRMVREAGLKDALKQIELQVWQHSQALLSDRNILREALNVRNNAEQSLRISTERFKSGAGVFSDVLNAQNTVTNTRFQWLEAHASLFKSQLRLASSLGRIGPLAPK